MIRIDGVSKSFGGIQAVNDCTFEVAKGSITGLIGPMFLAHTKMGKSMFAMSDNVDLARISGVSVARVIFWTWVFAGALTAVAGILLGVNTRLIPTMGWNTLLRSSPLRFWAE